MSALAGLAPPIWANEVERQLVWKTLHNRREVVKDDMAALEERIRTGGASESLTGAWHVLDTEYHLLGEIIPRIVAGYEPPVDLAKLDMPF